MSVQIKICVFFLVTIIGVQCASKVPVTKQAKQASTPSVQNDINIDSPESSSSSLLNNFVPSLPAGMPNVGDLAANNPLMSMLNNLQGQNSMNTFGILTKLVQTIRVLNELLSTLGGNSLDRITTNIGEVVKGTDGVLDTTSAQFQRINNENVGVLKQLLNTGGTAAVKFGELGTNALGFAENAMYSPWETLNPLQYVKPMIPFFRPSAQEQLMDKSIQRGLAHIKSDHPVLYHTLMKNRDIYNYLKSDKPLFNQLLRNPDALKEAIDNPMQLVALKQQQQQQLQQQQLQQQQQFQQQLQ